MSFYFIKLIVYILQVILGINKSLKTNSNIYILFAVWSALDVITIVSLEYYFTSNLEVLVINDVISKLILFLFFIGSVKDRKILNVMSVIGFLLTFVLAVLLFNYDFIFAEPYLYSDYGYLNTYEYFFYVFISTALSAIPFIYGFLKVLSEGSEGMSTLFLIFGLLFMTLMDLLSTTIHTYFLGDLITQTWFLKVCLLIGFYVTHGFVLLGLLWKK